MVQIKRRYEPAEKVTLHNTEPSRTKQSMKDECDINNILKRYQTTGVLTHVKGTPAQYGDFSNVKDYQSALHELMSAQASFMELPSKIRARFENDPAQFLEFVGNPANVEEMYTLGLAVRPADKGTKDPAPVKEPRKE